MKRSVRKKMSVTNLTMARVKYIRYHYFQFVSTYTEKRQDIANTESMNKDTMVFEVGIEVLFRAICKAMEVPIEEADKLAIDEYSAERELPENFTEQLLSFVELEHDMNKKASITLEDRQKAVAAYRAKKNQEISDEWDE